MTLKNFSEDYEFMQPFRGIIYKFISKALKSLYFLIQKFYFNTFSSKEIIRNVHKISYKLFTESHI